MHNCTWVAGKTASIASGKPLIPSTQPTGTVYLYAKADPFYQVAETNESNNNSVLYTTVIN